MTPEVYSEFSEAIRSAGFHTNGLEHYRTWSRTCVVAHWHPQGGYSGNSFWVTCIHGDWYIGTWGGGRYRFPKRGQIVDFCIAWLTHQSTSLASDIDLTFQRRFGLIPLSSTEFDQVVESE